MMRRDDDDDDMCIMIIMLFCMRLSGDIMEIQLYCVRGFNIGELRHSFKYVAISIYTFSCKSKF